MAVTAGGTPYVEASDLVADYPATSLALANKVDTKLDNAPTDNAQSGTTYTFVLGDARNITTATNAGAKTFTIPPQASVAWLANSQIRVVNYGAGALTVNGGAGVTVTNTTSTLAQYQAATAIRTGSNAWTLVPFSGGAGNADFSDAATGTYTLSGVNYKYKTYTGSGSVTFTKAGRFECLLVGAGAGGTAGASGVYEGVGGGGGEVAEYLNLFANIETISITVGAGGSIISGGASNSGADSLIGTVRANGGGGLGPTPGKAGASGGGVGSAGNGLNFTSLAISGRGFQSGGGRGAGGAGGASSGTTGGVGLASLFTGVSVTYGAGGDGGNVGGGAGAAGGANTGKGGGGGSSTGSSLGGAGGSGIVIIRVRT